ncbi:MAG: PEP-CTERM sorting domain-containing protein [Verrucomicrobiota bacterium JB025]|nr:PEP-CTERM sorting domain-containing protein [Verrucomicrobiota bacterium JB025]
MNSKHLISKTLAVFTAAGATQAMAQNIEVNFINHSIYENVNGTTDNGGYEQSWPSGVMDFTVVSSGDSFDAFCVEPSQGISYGETLIYEVQDPSSLSNYDTIARLVGGYLASSQTDLEAAATYWALMEVTAETGATYSLTAGSVQITELATPLNQEVADLADSYLANVGSYTAAEIVYLSNATRQDVVVFGDGVTSVPEPSAIALVALSGLALLGRRR